MSTRLEFLLFIFLCFTLYPPYSGKGSENHYTLVLRHFALQAPNSFQDIVLKGETQYHADAVMFSIMKNLKVSSTYSFF